MAELGFEVLGLGVLPEKSRRCSPARCRSTSPGLPELLQKNLDSGRLRFTTSYEEGVRNKSLMGWRRSCVA